MGACRSPVVAPNDGPAGKSSPSRPSTSPTSAPSAASRYSGWCRRWPLEAPREAHTGPDRPPPYPFSSSPNPIARPGAPQCPEGLPRHQPPATDSAAERRGAAAEFRRRCARARTRGGRRPARAGASEQGRERRVDRCDTQRAGANRGRCMRRSAGRASSGRELRELYARARSAVADRGHPPRRRASAGRGVSCRTTRGRELGRSDMRSKLTEERAEDAARLVAEGLTLDAVAERLACTPHPAALGGARSLFPRPLRAGPPRRARGAPPRMLEAILRRRGAPAAYAARRR